MGLLKKRSSKFIHCLIPALKKDPKLLDFELKIIHYILPTKAFLIRIGLTENEIYYLEFSGISSGSKSIKTLSRQWRYHFYSHMCDIIFDQSARSIFARCQALVVFRRVSAVWLSFGLLGVFELVFSRVEVKFILKWRQAQADLSRSQIRN